MASSTLACYGNIVMIFIVCHCIAALRVDITPESYSRIHSDEVNITCISDGPTHWANTVVTLTLSKVGQKTIAIYSLAGLIEGPGFKPDMKAEGHLEKDARLSYLTVTIKHPGIDEVGTYVCSMLYIDESLKTKEMRAKANLTIADEDLTTMFKFLARKMSELDNTVKEQSKVISHQTLAIDFLEKTVLEQNVTTQGQANLLKEQSITIEEQANLLKEQNITMQGQANLLKEQNVTMQRLTNLVKEQNVTMQRLTNLLKEQNVTIREEAIVLKELSVTVQAQGNLIKEQNVTMEREENLLKELSVTVQYQANLLKEQNENDKTASGFSARLHSSLYVKQDDMVVFPNAVVNIGNNYDPKTGVYSAPVNGLYVFGLFVLTYEKGTRVQISIVTNNKICAELVLYNNDSDDQSSISCVVQLKARETVKVRVERVIPSYRRVTGFDYTGFDGFLIQSL